MTAKLLDCDDVKTDHDFSWGFSDKWVAECRGVTFDCERDDSIATCRLQSGGDARGMYLPQHPPPPLPPPR
jgi:hypothetical protein